MNLKELAIVKKTRLGMLKPGQTFVPAVLELSFTADDVRTVAAKEVSPHTIRRVLKDLRGGEIQKVINPDTMVSVLEYPDWPN